MLEVPPTVTKLKVRSVLVIVASVPPYLDFQADIKKLQKYGIPVFEKLIQCIGDYIDWWSWIALRVDFQKISSDQLVIRYTKIRSDLTIRKWGELKDNFILYIQEVCLPFFFCLSFCAEH